MLIDQIECNGWLKGGIYSGVIEAEPEERKLEIKVLVHLLVGGVNVALQISLVFRAASIEEPVHELAANLC